MIRLLHLGDLHPDNAGTFAGKTVIDPASGLNRALVDLEESLRFVHAVATAPDETRCHAALITGDLFDSPRPHMNEVRVIVDFVNLLASEMPILIIPGNHDLSQNTSDASALACLAGIPNVMIRERPDTILLELGGQPVWCSFLPYPTKGRLLTQEDMGRQTPEHINAVINEGLGAILRGMGARIDADYPHILLAHGSVSGALQVGDQPRSLAHDILLPREELRYFDYVALGHIHQHQRVAENAWYSGSLMRQSFGEEKEDKGFVLAGIEGKGEVRIAFVHNPCARVYRTVSINELGGAGFGADAEAVIRVKDRVTADALESSRAVLDATGQIFPYFQQEIEIVAADRARDAGMASVPSAEEAIMRALAGEVEEEELAVIVSLHGVIAEEVGR